MRLGVCCRLSEDVGPVGFHNVSGWLLGVVDAFQDGGYAAGSVLLPVPPQRGVLSSPGLSPGSRWR